MVSQNSDDGSNRKSVQPELPAYSVGENIGENPVNSNSEDIHVTITRCSPGISETGIKLANEEDQPGNDLRASDTSEVLDNRGFLVSEGVQDVVHLSGTVKKKKKSRIAMSLQKKFSSLTFGRRSKLAGGVIRKDTVDIIKDGPKQSSSEIVVASFQLGLAYAVGKLTSKPGRDVLLHDFTESDEIRFPKSGTTLTPSHRLNDFVMVDYAPIAFRFFRDIFKISPSDFMASLGINPLVQISNPGASGSLFFLSDDDQFIVKSVDKRETVFLQEVLPGYYMNVHQNPQTHLPKFFGMYSFRTLGKTLRVVVMNNLLPSKLPFHEKYDLKGSTYQRKASEKERFKTLPTLKDLDFVMRHPMGLSLTSENRENLMRILESDVRVLQSFEIMDYSLLVSVHNVTLYRKSLARQQRYEDLNGKKDERHVLDDETYKTYISKGVPARNRRGESLILFIGIIDILQKYGFKKKTEHRFKSLLHDGDTVSVHNPKYYASRFINFLKYVFQDNDKEAKPYPYLSTLQSISGTHLYDVVTNRKDSMSKSKQESDIVEPQVIVEESPKVTSEISNEIIGIDKTTEPSTHQLEEDQI